MEEFKNILFPVDLSDTSPKIVKYVRQMAEKFNSRIHLLFVVRLFDHYSNIYVNNPLIGQFQAEALEGAEKRLNEFSSEHFKDFQDITVATTSGDISEEILDYINNHTIDLIIIGTHGRKGLEKVFFGSIAERVAKTAPIPVLLINPYKCKSCS